MATPPAGSEVPELQFDSSRPFRGVVLCCTSIAPELRTEIAAKAVELGGVHKYDLTPDVTHLVVGEYATPKYRHVARERPDIVPVAAGWVEAVRDLWVADADIDFAALEAEWRLKTFETSGGEEVAAAGAADGGGGTMKVAEAVERNRLLLCLTGFDDAAERQQIVDLILAHGAAYTGDLTRKVTHLVVARPEGKKFVAAKAWGLHAVSIEWLRDSVARGMILDEARYDPLLPPEERGVGAWTVRQPQRSTLGKRLRDAAVAQEQRRAKLRRTASFKLSSQMGNIWGGIAAKEAAPIEPKVEPEVDAPGAEVRPSASAAAASRSTSTLAAHRRDTEVFASCVFYRHGFLKARHDVLGNALLTLGGTICPSLEAVSSHDLQPTPAFRFLIVPQESKPETHPRLPDGVHIVTEFYVEKCLHKKRFFDPAEHVIGRPFPQFPIDGFEQLAICTAGFTDVDLNQIDKTIRQLGARFEETFTKRTSVLVCSSLGAVRKQKLDLALAWRVPVVSADWLWQCIETGYRAPMADFLFPELGQRLSLSAQHVAQKKTEHKDSSDSRKALPKIPPEPFDEQKVVAPERRRGVPSIDPTAFAKDDTAPQAGEDEAQGRDMAKEESNATTHFETAPTHLNESMDRDSGGGLSKDGSTSRDSAPLSERSVNSLMRSGSASPLKQQQHQQQPQPAVSALPARTLGTTPRRTTRSRQKENDAEAEDEGKEGSSETLAGEMNVYRGGGTKRATRSLKHGAKNTAEEEKAARLAAERQALSSKLASLLRTSGLATTVTTAGNNSEGDSMHDHSVASAGSATRLAAGSRRRRGILGRAVSNVSAASSGSVESPGGAVAGNATLGTTSAKSLKGEYGLVAGGSGVAEGEEEIRPPATQLEFRDPEAKKHREQLLSKMMGAVRTRSMGVAAAEGGGVGVEVGGAGLRELEDVKETKMGGAKAVIGLEAIGDGGDEDEPLGKRTRKRTSLLRGQHA